VSIQHIYQTAGDFNVVLVVTDDRDLTGRTNHQISVIPSPPELPQPAIRIEPSPAEVDEEVTFDGSASQPGGGGDIVSYQWEIVEIGETLGGEVVTYNFDTAGIYTVRLTVTDEEGYGNLTETSLEVTESPVLPTVEPTEEPTVEPTEEPTAEPTEEVQPPTARITVNIEGVPQPDPITAEVGQEIIFDCNDSDPGEGGNKIAKCTWEFGDGGTSDKKQATYIYTAENTYTVSLTVRNSKGLDDTASLTVTVLAPEAEQLPAEPEPETQAE
jgi:PKD repeat protein